MKIEDFGEKIGGARKDLWKVRGLQTDDLEIMNVLEREKFVTKNNVWKKPDYQKLINEGVSRRVVYFMKMVRDSLPIKPMYLGSINSKDIEEIQANYITVIRDLKEITMNLRDESDILSYYQKNIKDIYIYKTSFSNLRVASKAQGIVNNKFLNAAQHSSFFHIDREIQKKKFCFSKEELLLNPYHFYIYSKNSFQFETKEENTVIFMKKDYLTHIFYPAEKFSSQVNYKENSIIVCKGNEIIEINVPTIEEAKRNILESLQVISPEKKKEEISNNNSQRKNRFIPSQLTHIKRDGFSYRNHKNVKSKDFLDVFKFKGGEFGNWLNDKDRQASLNYAFDAFLDLAIALDIHPSSIAIDKKLSIAFGSRGVGSALAHYEPLRNVINLTKLKGAGSLAHEWGHALDDMIGKHFGMIGFASNHSRYSREAPVKMKELMDTMKYDESNNKTKFYKDSMEFDKKHTKTTHGYWSSNEELFARAFACYVHDKLPYTSDYLTGHANTVVSGDLYAYPVGVERERINLQFDTLLEFIKEVNIVQSLSIKDLEVVKKNFESSINREAILNDVSSVSADQMKFDFEIDEPEM